MATRFLLMLWARKGVASALILVIGLLSFLLPGCGGGGDANNADSRGAVSGYVYATGDGRIVLGNASAAPPGATAVSGATVRLLDSPTGATSERSGKFSLGNLTPGRHTLRLERPGAAAVDIPITVIADATVALGETTVPRSQALTAVQNALISEGLLDRARILAPQHPLPAGVRIAAAIDSESRHDETTGIAAPTWFVFVDLAPGGRWQHECRFYRVDAQDGHVSYTTELSFPEINGRVYYGDIRDDDTSADLVHAGATRAASSPKTRVANAPGANASGANGGRFVSLRDDKPCGPAIPITDDGRATGSRAVGRDHALPPCSDPKTYSLVVLGDPRPDMEADVTRMQSFLAPGRFQQAGATIPASYRPPTDGYVAAKAQVLDKYDQICAVARPCDTVFIYVSSHGTSSGAVVLDRGAAHDGDEAYPDSSYLYPWLDFDLSKIRACHVVMIFDCCFSGRIVDRMKETWENSSALFGKKLWVMSGADSTEYAFGSSQTNPPGGYFTTAFIDAMNFFADSSGTVPMSKLGDIFEVAAFDTTRNTVEAGLTTERANMPIIHGAHPRKWSRNPGPGETCGSGIVPTPTPTPGTSVNLPPRLTRISNVFLPDLHSNAFQIDAVDPEGDALTYTWSWSGPATACGSDAGSGSGGPKTHIFHHNGCSFTSEQATTVTVTVRDSRGNVSSRTIGLREEGAFDIP